MPLAEFRDTETDEVIQGINFGGDNIYFVGNTLVKAPAGGTSISIVGGEYVLNPLGLTSTGIEANWVIQSEQIVGDGTWTVTVENQNSGDIKSGVLPFNEVDGNSYVTECDTVEVLASCGGYKVETDWVNKGCNEIQLLKGTGETIEAKCPAGTHWDYVTQTCVDNNAGGDFYITATSHYTNTDYFSAEARAYQSSCDDSTVWVGGDIYEAWLAKVQIGTTKVYCEYLELSGITQQPCEKYMLYLAVADGQIDSYLNANYASYTKTLSSVINVPCTESGGSSKTYLITDVVTKWTDPNEISITVPSTAIRGEVLNIPIANYSASHTYNIVVTGGSYVLVGSSIEWTMPDAIDTTLTITVTASDSVNTCIHGDATGDVIVLDCPENSYWGGSSCVACSANPEVHPDQSLNTYYADASATGIPIGSSVSFSVDNGILADFRYSGSGDVDLNNVTSSSFFFTWRMEDLTQLPYDSVITMTVSSPEGCGYEDIGIFHPV